jgi:hypothetical protein
VKHIGNSSENMLLYSTITTRYRMATETANTAKSNAVRIGEDKMKRAAKVARKLAVKQDKRVPVLMAIDLALENGLGKLERELGI